MPLFAQAGMAELADAADLKSSVPKLNRLNTHEMIGRFIMSRRSGLSSLTIKNYRLYLDRSIEVIGADVTWEAIQSFLDTRSCSGGGRHAYYRVLKVFYNWLYSRRSGYGLKSGDNPIVDIQPPVVEDKILPSLTASQVEVVIKHARCVRDKAIVSLFADSGLRLRELASINIANIDWQRRLIKVRCKGNKEGLAPFGGGTETLLKQWLTEYTPINGQLFNLTPCSIEDMLKLLKQETGLPCNPHTFRRTFASILSKRNVDSLHIMRLGRWKSLSMVQRYTKSVKFDDSLQFYSPVVS